jgi:hypothetical protein
VRREATGVRKLHSVKEDMLGLPTAGPERAAVRGDPDCPQAYCGGERPAAGP